MDFKNVPNRYRPVPFWSWNEKLSTEETQRQIQLMHDAGIGGFFMHARGGLQTEYMGEEWFDNVTAGIEKANELGMYAWAYDENGWPSGFGGGKVNGKGEKYQQKYLRMGDKPDAEHHRIADVDGKCFYFEINPFYVDVLDASVTQDFLDEIYEPYYARYGSGFAGFFTDEPQISRNGIPWSNVMLEEYEARYGESLIPHLPELFLKQGDYVITRVRYWKLVTDLFSANFMKKIYDWCEGHGLKFTGHMVCEETFRSQLYSNGAVMPHYEYLSIPGMDCLGRHVIYDLTPWQLGSACQQLGKKQVLSETFALCGHNVSFDELRLIYSHQMVHGVNLLCQHLEGYSLRGIRKRDYPPAMYYQQPWWEEYEKFNTAMSRVGMILAEGKCEVDTLLMHPQTSAWTMYDAGKCEGIHEYYERFKAVVNRFDALHIPFHLGDETLMERHGRVEGNKLIIGQMTYTTVVIPEHILFLENTERLLAEFKANGGKVVTPEEVTARCDVVDNENIIYTKRILDNGTAYFLLNHTEETQTANIVPGSYILDQYTGEKLPFNGEYTFAPRESLMIIDDGSQRYTAEEKCLKNLDLSGQWKVEACTPNILTLDRCDYYFDGKLEEENGYVLNIQNRALALERPVNIRQVYHVNVETVPGEVTLLCETPEIFEIQVNGKTINNQADSWMIDTAFKKLDISGLLVPGENTITMTVDFSQEDEVYENLKKARIFESEKNKLHYGMEIEPCYLVGNFGVRAEGAVTKLDKDAFRVPDGFTICAMPETVTLTELEKQGFLFFAGKLTVSKEVELTDVDYRVALNRKGFNVVKVAVNDTDAGLIMYKSNRVDCSGLLKPGTNKITLTLLNNLRNMMGPHHLDIGECYSVGPGSFFKEPCVYAPRPGQSWDDDYCFVEMSVEAE